MVHNGPGEDERALIQRAATGDHEALRRLVLAYAGETARHPHEQLLAPWLYRIATNQAISLLRKRLVRQRVHAPSPLINEGGGTSDAQAQDIYPAQESFEDH